MKDKLDDEIKLAGLESLVPEELEKHLILNSNRLRTFQGARLEVVTCVEAKFGLRFCYSRPSDTGSRGHSDPMDVDAVNSLSSGKGKASSSPLDGCFKCGGAHFQRDCNARKNTGKQSSGKGKQSKSWSKSESKGSNMLRGRKIRMGPTSCHLPCIVPTASTRCQIPFHHDVISQQQQPFCQEAWHWTEVATYGPYSNAGRACGYGCG